MSDHLAALILSYLDERTVLDTSDPDRERRENTVWFSIPEGPVDPGLVERALIDVGDALGVRHRDGDGPATFYAWYDEQAGQLRCSMVTAPPGALPFSGRFEVVHDPSPVVALVVGDPHPGLVTWSELEPGHAVDAVEDYPFPVFVSIVRP